LGCDDETEGWGVKIVIISFNALNMLGIAYNAKKKKNK
jgi:hypothetical protein